MGTLLLALPLQPEVETAVRKGLAFLKNAEGELAAWALVYAGEDLPRELPAPASTRSAALQAMILEKLDRVKELPRIAHRAQQLIDTQCGDGLWVAGRAVDMPDLPLPPPTPGRKPIDFGKRRQLLRRAEGGEKGEAELARWALMGILAGYEAGLIPPADAPGDAAATTRRTRSAGSRSPCICGAGISGRTPMS